MRLHPGREGSSPGWLDKTADRSRQITDAATPKDAKETLVAGEAEEWDGEAIKAAIAELLKTTTPQQRRAFFSQNIALASFRERAGDFLIYNANHLALRGVMNISRKEPLGIHGENLDVTIASLGDDGLRELLDRSAVIRWVERIFTDPEDRLKFEGYKLGRSTSTLYFRDRFMKKRANVFSAENANEGILHALFYLTLFISDRTPKTFGIDNIETALNPAAMPQPDQAARRALEDARQASPHHHAQPGRARRPRSVRRRPASLRGGA